jgi:phage shock protein A
MVIEKLEKVVGMAVLMAISFYAGMAFTRIEQLEQLGNIRGAEIRAESSTLPVLVEKVSVLEARMSAIEAKLDRALARLE